MEIEQVEFDLHRSISATIDLMTSGARAKGWICMQGSVRTFRGSLSEIPPGSARFCSTWSAMQSSLLSRVP
jgi:hypothetical protein